MAITAESNRCYEFETVTGTIRVKPWGVAFALVRRPADAVSMWKCDFGVDGCQFTAQGTEDEMRALARKLVPE